MTTRTDYGGDVSMMPEGKSVRSEAADLSPTPPENLQEALNASLAAMLRPFFIGAAVLVSAYSVLDYLNHPWAVAGPITVMNLSVLGLVLVLWIASIRRPVTPRWAHPVAALLVASFVTDNLFSLYLTADPWLTFDTALIVVGCGCFFLSTRWLGAVISAALLSWAAIAAAVLPADRIRNYASPLVVSAILSAIIHLIRRRAAVRLEMLRRRELEQRRELSITLAAAEESEEQYRELVESSPMGIVVHIDGTIVFANAKAIELAGAGSEDDMVGRPALDFVHPDDAARVRERMRLILATGESQRAKEIKLLRLDGETVDVEITGGVATFGGKPAIRAIYRDISERKRAERARQKSEEAYRTLVESAHDAIYVMDNMGRFTYVNPNCLRLTGYSEEELLAMSYLQVVSPAYRDEALSVGVRQAEEKTPSVLFEFPILRKDGSEVWVEQHSMVLVEEGRLAGFQGVTRDITERREAEADKRKLEEQLRHSQKMEGIGTLAGGVAHDFNNLLAGILGYADMLKISAEVGEPTFKAADQIQKAASRAAQLTRQLLGFARRGKHQNVTVDLHQRVREVTALLGRTLNKNITIERDFCERCATTGDPDQIEQVILNLAVNAKDALAEGGTLTFRTSVADFSGGIPPEHPDARAVRYAVLTVADTGMGIAESDRERIFEPFFTTKPRDKGTGMGLAMVYGIVDNHGGFVHVESEAGSGTSFHVHLPLSEIAEPAASPQRREDKPVQGVGRVLIVDDERIVRTMATDMLESLGYEVATASDGKEAVEYYEEHGESIDLVIIDMVMPVMGGGECYRTLRKIDPDVRAILSSGFSRDGEAQEILDEGSIDFLQKPYLVEQFSRAVAAALD